MRRTHRLKHATRNIHAIQLAHLSSYQRIPRREPMFRLVFYVIHGCEVCTGEDRPSQKASRKTLHPQGPAEFTLGLCRKPVNRKRGSVFAIAFRPARRFNRFQLVACRSPRIKRQAHLRRCPLHLYPGELECAGCYSTPGQTQARIHRRSAGFGYRYCTHDVGAGLPDKRGWSKSADPLWQSYASRAVH